MRTLPRRLLLSLFVGVVDVLIIFDAFAIAYLLRFQLQLAPAYWPPEPPLEYLKAMVVVAWFWLLLFRLCGLYDLSRNRSDIDTVYLVFRATGFGSLIILSLSYFYREFSFSRLVVVYAWALSLALFSVFHVALNRYRMSRHRAGHGTRRVLIVGSRTLARFLAGRMREQPELGYRLVGLIDDEPPEDPPAPVLGGIADLESVLRSRRVDRVFLAHPALGHLRLLEVVETCERLGVSLSMVPATYDLLINHQDFEEIDGIPLVSLREREARRLYHALKRTADVVVATVGLVALAPVWAAVALAIRLEDGGDALFTQTRIGKDGAPFRILKFRTMVVGAEALLPSLVDVGSLPQPVFKLDGDPRVTRVGRLLRRTSLDEVPQLINVLRGEMSLVGPRPEEELVVRRYGVQERRRLKAKPGLTGLQQVECRGSVDLRERVRWDIVYLRKQSLLLDAWILVKTLWVVALGRGAR